MTHREYHLSAHSHFVKLTSHQQYCNNPPRKVVWFNPAADIVDKVFSYCIRLM
jgi:hypothetical protein